MRARFSSDSASLEAARARAQTLEMQVRAAWERQYKLPSLGNPLFEDVPLFQHIAHLMALRCIDEMPEPVDEHMTAIAATAQRGLDPFKDIRDKLKAVQPQSAAEPDDDDDELTDILF